MTVQINSDLMLKFTKIEWHPILREAAIRSITIIYWPRP